MIALDDHGIIRLGDNRVIPFSLYYFFIPLLKILSHRGWFWLRIRKAMHVRRQNVWPPRGLEWRSVGLIGG